MAIIKQTLYAERGIFILSRKRVGSRPTETSRSWAPGFGIVPVIKCFESKSFIYRY